MPLLPQGYLEKVLIILSDLSGCFFHERSSLELFQYVCVH